MLALAILLLILILIMNFRDSFTNLVQDPCKSLAFNKCVANKLCSWSGSGSGSGSSKICKKL